MKRKTTLPSSSNPIIEISDSESDSSVTNRNVRTKKVASSVKSKSNGDDRECDECHDTIEVGVDMYRYHHTGCKVCKDCWLKVDPNEMSIAKKRRKLQKPTSTKLCSVFLEDIFVGPPENKKKGSTSKAKDVEEDYDVCDDSVDDETETKTNLQKSKLRTRSMQNDQKSPKKSKVVPKKRPTKSTLQNNNPDKKIKQEVSSKPPEVQEKTYRTKKTRSRLSALREKKIELSKLKSESLKKSQLEQRRKKLQSKLRQSRSRESSDLPSANEEVSEPQKTQEDKDLSMIVDSDSENSGPYTCNICSTDYENRVEGLKHELTHSKKLGVVLEKVAVADDETNEQPSDVTDKSVTEPPTNPAEESHVSDVPTAKSDETKVDDDMHIAVESKTNEVDGKQSMETNDDKENPPEDVGNDSDKKVVDCNDENDVTEKLVGDEKNTDVDKKDDNVDVDVAIDENNIRAEDSNFETKTSNLDTDHDDVNEKHDDDEKNLGDKEVNAETHEINEPSTKESETENMPTEIEAKDKNKDDDSESILRENDPVENIEKNENHVQQKEETNNVDVENLSESTVESNKTVEQPNNQIHVDNDSDDKEKKDSQSEEGDDESSKLSCNTEKLGIEGCENDEKLIENKAETESKLVEYENSLKVDEKVESLEPSIDTGTEKNENRVDKLQKIIDASFGDSLQE